MSGNVEYTITNLNGTSPITDLVISYPQSLTSGQTAWSMSYEGPNEASVAVDGTNTFTEWVAGMEVGTLSANISSTSWYFDFPGIPGITDMSNSLSAPGINGEFDAFPCFVAGTLIDTPSGACAVEDLVPGDVVATNDGAGTVTWIGHRHAKNALVVRFSPHAFGPGMPRHELCVSCDHAMFIDGVLVPAALLVNGETIIKERWIKAAFYHVELERHAILHAAGAQAESYLDTGNRSKFGNCPFSYDSARPEQEPCAEMVVAGPRLDQARFIPPKAHRRGRLMVTAAKGKFGTLRVG